MLARSLLRFRQFDLRALPPADQQSALRSQLAAWQPFANPAYFVQWRAGLVDVYACAADVLEGLAPRQVCWPESCLLPSMEEGVRLVALLEGFEGQKWSGGALRSSRWWPELPTGSNWLGFVRAAGLSGEGADLPAAQTLAWVPPRPVPVPLAQLGQTQFGALQAAVAVGLLVLTALTGYAAHGYVAARQALDTQQTELAALRERAQPVLDARSRALALQTQLTDLLAPLSAPQPVEVLDHLTRVLPKGVLLKELELQGLELRVQLETPPDVARSQLIEALEAGGWLGSVAEQPGPRAGVTLQMKLKGARSPDATLGEPGMNRKSTDKPEPDPVPKPPQPQPGAKP